MRCTLEPGISRASSAQNSAHNSGEVGDKPAGASPSPHLIKRATCFYSLVTPANPFYGSLHKIHILNCNARALVSAFPRRKSEYSPFLYMPHPDPTSQCLPKAFLSASHRRARIHNGKTAEQRLSHLPTLELRGVMVTARSDRSLARTRTHQQRTISCWVS